MMSNTPTTPTEAAAVLAQREIDPEWGKRLLAGDAATNAEFRALTELSSKADLTEKQIAADMNALLRDRGVDQALSGRKISRDEYEAAKALEARLINDQAWCKRFLAGDVDAIREMTETNVILASEIAEDAQ